MAYALALQSSAPSIMSHTSDPALNSNCDDDDGFSSCLGNGEGGMKLEAIFNSFNIHVVLD